MTKICLDFTRPVGNASDFVYRTRDIPQLSRSQLCPSQGGGQVRKFCSEQRLNQL